MALAAAMMWWPSEALSVGTLMLFAPRWLALFPLVFLAPLAMWRQRIALVPVGLTILLWLAAYSGFVLNWPRSHEGAIDRSLRIVSCNMQGGGIDYVAFHQFLQDTKPDLVLLQEWSDGHRQAAFPDAGWKLAESGGLWVACRQSIKPLDGMPRGKLALSASAGIFDATTPVGEVRIANVHLPTVRDGLSAVIHRRFRGLPALRANTRLRNEISAEASRFTNVSSRAEIVAGDFNMPVESNIYRTSWCRLDNAFNQAGFGWGNTKYTSWHGIRIDHILFGDRWQCRFARVGPDVGSDHRPLFAILVPSDAQSK